MRKHIRSICQKWWPQGTLNLDCIGNHQFSTFWHVGSVNYSSRLKSCHCQTHSTSQHCDQAGLLVYLGRAVIVPHICPDSEVTIITRASERAGVAGEMLDAPSTNGRLQRCAPLDRKQECSDYHTRLQHLYEGVLKDIVFQILKFLTIS